MKQNYLEQVQVIIADKKIHVWEKQKAFNDLQLTNLAGNAKAGARAALDAIAEYWQHINDRRRLLKLRYTQEDYFTFYTKSFFDNMQRYIPVQPPLYQNVCHEYDEYGRRRAVEDWTSYEAYKKNLKEWGKKNAALVLEYKKRVADGEKRRKKNAAFAKKNGVNLYIQAWHDDRKHFITFADFINSADRDCAFEFSGKIVEIKYNEEKEYPYKGKYSSYPKITHTIGFEVFENGKSIYTSSVYGTRKSQILPLIMKYFGIEKLKKVALKKVQVNEWQDVILEKTEKNLRVYRLEVGGVLSGYAAYDGEMTYHAATLQDVKKEVKRKKEAMKAEELKKKEAMKVRWTAAALHERFRFCFAGMTDFCERAGLDINGEYSIADLRAAIARCGISKNYKYSAELKKIGCL